MTPETKAPTVSLLTLIEEAIDATGVLTRKRTSGFLEQASLTFTRDGWTARCDVRNKSRAARCDEISGSGETPELAAADLVSKIPTWLQVLS